MTIELSSNEWAKYWFYVIGVNTFPANTKEKKPYYTDKSGNKIFITWSKSGYQTESITEKQFQEWLKIDAFKDGLAVICGKVYRGKHQGKYLNCYDCDNKLGVDELVGTSTLVKISAKTLVEQSSNKDKAHFYFYTTTPVESKAWNKSDKDKPSPQIEVKSGGNMIMYCAGGMHKNGSLIDIVDCKEPLTVEKENLELNIETIYKKYNPHHIEKVTTNIVQEIKEGVPENMGEGDNRGLLLLRRVDQLKFANPDFDADDMFPLVEKLNKTFKTPKPESVVRQLIKQGMGWVERILDEEGNDITVEAKAEELLLVKDKKETLKELKDFTMKLGEPKGDTILNEIIKVTQKKIKQSMIKGSKLYSNEAFTSIANHIKGETQFLTIRETGKSHYYDEKKEMYLPNGDTIIEEACQRLAQGCNNQTASEVKGIIHRKDTMILAEALFSNNLISCYDGVIDSNYDLQPPSSKHYVTKKMPFHYNMKARNLKLWNVILDIIDPKDIIYFLEMLWTLISFKNNHKKCIILYGVSNTRKSTLMDFVKWIVGSDNLSNENPAVFLQMGDRFTLSRMLGKSGNIAEEIGNITSDMWENFKTFIGSGEKTAESKGSNAGRKWDPKEFLFTFSTNNVKGLRGVINDDSIINRIQFMTFKNEIIPNSNWEDDLFSGPEEKQECVDTIVNILIHRMKYQAKSKKNRTVWDTKEQTKDIIEGTLPVHEKYFLKAEGRIIEDSKSEITYKDIEEDFLDYTKHRSVSYMKLGTLLRQHGITEKRKSMRTVIYSGWKLPFHSSSRGDNGSLDDST